VSAAKKGMEAFKEGRYEKAIAQFTAATERITHSPELYYHLGLAHVEQGNMNLAQDAFQAALELKPEKDEANILGGLGLAAYHKGDYTNALVTLTRALAAAPDNNTRARVLTMMGMVEASRQNYSLARLNYLRARKADRSYAPAYYNVAVLYQEQFSLLEEALDEFKLFLGVTDKKNKNREKAENHIKRLNIILERRKAERESIRRRPAQAAGFLQEGVNAAAAKQYPKAVKAYKDALTADPFTFNAALGLGTVYRQQGLRAEALDAFKKASDIKPEHQDSYHQAADLALQLRQPAEAVKLLNRAIARSPFNPESARLMAQAAYAEVRISEARAYGEFYLSLVAADDPNRAAFERWVMSLPKN